MVMIIVVLLLAALALWALGQFPLDPTIVKLIRVVIIVACVLFLLSGFGLLPAGLRWHYN